MSNISYRKKILAAVRHIASVQRDMNGLNIKNIAKTANVNEKIVRAEFKDLNEIFYEAAILRFKEHELKSVQISNLTGSYALTTLIRHDLESVILISRYTLENQNQELSQYTVKAFKHVQNYFDNVMPKYYYHIFSKNPSLLPNKAINARLYAHFIVHSLFFFTKKEHYLTNPAPEEIKNITKRIINSLFVTAEETSSAGS